MMNIALLILALTPWICGQGYATTWYAADDGYRTNGTPDYPWGVKYAATNSQLLSGDLVLFQPGTFACSDTRSDLGLGNILELKRSGVTYQPVNLWGFSFDGGLLIYSSSNVTIKNFRIFYSGSTNRDKTVSMTHPSGITEFSTGNRIMHNLIDNTGHPGIGSWSSTSGKYITGNIIRFTGINDYTDGYTNAHRGSGMYLQNDLDSPEALIKGNISYFNYTTGMKAYGNTDIYGFNFTQNICVDNNEAGIFYHQDHVDSQGVLMISNYIWKGNPGLRIGYQLGNNNPSNAVISWNYVVDTNLPIALTDDWKNLTITNNTLVNPLGALVFELGTFPDSGEFDTTHVMSGNSYHASSVGNNFIIYNTNLLSGITLAEWKSYTTTDTDSTMTASKPLKVETQVFRPSSDSSFVYLAVFNWPTNPTTTVNLSAYFPKGARLSIYDAQDIPNAYTNLTFTGGNVSLDLTRTNRAEMLGSFSGREWSGFDPRFRAFVIHATSSKINLQHLSVERMNLSGVE